jgi:hypothetical protein
MGVTYEWDVETLAGVGHEAEVLDHNHADRLKDYDPHHFFAGNYVRDGLAGRGYCRLVLVREEEDGSRCWAYVSADPKAKAVLPVYFSVPEEDGKEYPVGHRVPVRFHAELRRWLATHPLDFACPEPWKGASE